MPSSITSTLTSTSASTRHPPSCAAEQPPDKTRPLSGDLESVPAQEEKGVAALRDGDGVLVIDGVPVVQLTGPEDLFSPLNMSTVQKWIIVCVVSSASLCVTCCSSMVAFSYPGTQSEYGVSTEVITLGLSLFVAGLGFFPLLVGPLSEFYGRTPIYLTSYVFFIAWNFLVAFSNNITAWLFGRFLAGASGAAFLSVAGGTVADIFAPHQVGAPMGFYTASPFLGPVLGPILSGFINQHLNWRWTWYILIMWAAVELLLLYFLCPETYLPALLVKKAKKLRREGREDVRAPLELSTESIPRVIATSCIKPFQILVLEPMCLVLCIWSSILLGILYMAFSAWVIVYRDGYGFTTQQTGLSFCGLGFGILIGSCSHPYWQSHYRRVMETTGKRPPPEEHLRRGLYGVVLVPAALFWFAFTTYPSIHWSVSVIATIPFGTGLLLSFQATFTFIVDAYRPVAASGMAANSAMRSSFAMGFPLFTHTMFKNLGTQWALALCAFLCLLIVPFPFLFFKYGSRLRRGSRFANKE